MYSIGNQGKIMRKLLGKPTPDAAHAAHAAHDAPSPAAVASIASSPLAPHHYRPATSQDVVYDAGVPIACLDRSADGRSAVLGGRSILKILSVDGVTIKETLDLRALIVAQPSQRNVLHASSADQLSIKAIRYSSMTWYTLPPLPLGRQSTASRSAKTRARSMLSTSTLTGTRGCCRAVRMASCAVLISASPP
jgi:hypothetical protein